MKPELEAKEFELLLAWLNPNSELAAAEYVRLHRRLIKMFDSRGCLASEERADETFNRVARQLAEGKAIHTDKPAAYIEGVARYILLEQRSKPQTDNLEEVPSAKLIEHDRRKIDEVDEQADLHACLEECLEKLPPETRRLVLEYYSEDKTLKIDTRDRMAKRLGIASSVLRNRIFKWRNNLRSCVAECLAAQVQGMEHERDET